MENKNLNHILDEIEKLIIINDDNDNNNDDNDDNNDNNEKKNNELNLIYELNNNFINPQKIVFDCSKIKYIKLFKEVLKYFKKIQSNFEYTLINDTKNNINYKINRSTCDACN